MYLNVAHLSFPCEMLPWFRSKVTFVHGSSLSQTYTGLLDTHHSLSRICSACVYLEEATFGFSILHHPQTATRNGASIKQTTSVC